MEYQIKTGADKNRRKSILYITGFPKITVFFILIIFFVIINAIINYYYISKDRGNIQKITELLNPYVEDLDQLNEIIIESKMFSTNWVYIQNSEVDKLKLDSLHKYKYPEIRAKLSKRSELLKNDFKDYSGIMDIKSIFSDIDKLILLQKKIMQTLNSFDDYESPAKKFIAEDIVESLLFPASEKVLTNLKIISSESKKKSDELKQSILTDSYRITNIMLLLSVFLLIFVVFSVYIIVTNIRRPSLMMKNIMDNLSKGELPNTQIKQSDNIIGDMAFSLNKLTENFKKTAFFAKQIEDGNLSAPYDKLSDNDLLGEALISMRDSLRSYSYEMEMKIKQRTDEVLLKGIEIETQKLFYESILSSIPLDIAIYNEDKKYIYVNNIAVRDNEIRKFLIGKTDREYCAFKNLNEELAVKRENFYNLARETNSTTEFEDEIKDEKGSTVSWKIRRFAPVFDGGTFRYMIAYGMDITGLKTQEFQIKESLEEKESLLGEIHHRVKNNLTLVLGLVEMQRDRQVNDDLKMQFNEIKNRIYAMSLIHDKMYKSHSFANIELQDYLKDLVTSVSRFYGKGKIVNLKFDLQKVSVKGKDAIPIALLMNEIVTNSFKYAFSSNESSDKEAGSLWVSLMKYTELNDEIELRVKDNGPGLPEGIDLSKSKSLGFKLIHIFVKQLRGELKYYNEDGLTFIIKFKL